MSRLCLGTVQFGMKYGVNNVLGRQPGRCECHEIIAEALQAGITYFDTATAYGEAETLLGEFSWGHFAPQIVSKLSPDCPDEAGAVLDYLRQSLQRLRRVKLYGYMLHRGKDMFKEGVMEGLMTAKKIGLIEKTGVSVYEPDEAMRAVSDKRIDLIQIPYNVLDKRLDKVGFFDKAQENNKEIYARSAFLQGLLLMNPQAAEQCVTKSGKFVAEFQDIAKDYGYTPTEAAMLYSLCHEGIDYVVFGVETVMQLKNNMAVQKKISSFSACYKKLKNLWRDVPKEILMPNLWR